MPLSDTNTPRSPRLGDGTGFLEKQERRIVLGGDLEPSSITARSVFRDRRRLLLAAGVAPLLGATGSLLPTLAEAADGGPPPGSGTPLAATKNSAYTLSDALTPYRDVTTYNNFYEFGTDKSDPARNAHSLHPRPWHVSIEGEVAHPRVLDLDALLKLAPLEERVYRMRCVEGWSMVIPWIGYPLSSLIKQLQPTSKAKYVQFVTLNDPKQMPGLKDPILHWPYVEGLRMDEAMNALTLLTFGLYGQVLPNQDGAPVRIVVPWKYGFKSAKSIVKIIFTEQQPATAWNQLAPHEYGFYSNVNPTVNHPRWSQATERRIGDSGLFTPKRPTLLFNGYGDQVASMYQGMDLKANF